VTERGDAHQGRVAIQGGQHIVSYDVVSVQRSGLQPAAAVSGQTQPNTAAPVAPTQAEPAVRVDTIPAEPPPEVLHAMAAADRAWQQLKDTGRELHFGGNPKTGKLTIELRDATGKVLETIVPSRALEIAAGQTPDQ
jgi:hypothetical protein